MPSSKERALLVHFISSLLKSKALQSRVLANPDETMKRFGLKPAQIKVLRTQHAGKIGRAMTAELRTFSRGIVKTNPEA